MAHGAKASAPVKPPFNSKLIAKKTNCIQNRKFNSFKLGQRTIVCHINLKIKPYSSKSQLIPLHSIMEWKEKNSASNEINHKPLIIERPIIRYPAVL